MKVKIKWKRRASAVLAICLMVVGMVAGAENLAFAATPSYVLEEGKTESIQLDGTGKKENMRFELEKGICTLYVNDKAVYSKHTTAQYGDVYVGSIDKNRKVLDIIIALYSQSYTGSYDVVDYCRYENGKLKKIQDLKKYLDTTLEKQIGKVETEDQMTYCYFHPMDNIKESVFMTGKSELKVTLCLPSNKSDAVDGFGTYHADYKLKLKNGKLVKKYSSAQGSMDEFATLMKTAKFNTTAGGKKAAFTAKNGEDIYLIEYEYVKNKLYVKGQNKAGKEGWICSENLDVFIGNHI